MKPSVEELQEILTAIERGRTNLGSNNFFLDVLRSCYSSSLFRDEFEMCYRTRIDSTNLREFEAGNAHPTRALKRKFFNAVERRIRKLLKDAEEFSYLSISKIEGIPNVTTKSHLVALLYDILRDHITPGDMERMLADLEHESYILSNGILANYAENIAKRLRRKPKCTSNSAESPN